LKKYMCCTQPFLSLRRHCALSLHAWCGSVHEIYIETRKCTGLRRWNFVFLQPAECFHLRHFKSGTCQLSKTTKQNICMICDEFSLCRWRTMVKTGKKACFVPTKASCMGGRKRTWSYTRKDH